MDQDVHTSGTAALRAKLRDTWLRDLVVHYRDIKRRVMRQSEGEAFLLRRYARIHGKQLHLANPPDLYGEAVLADDYLESGRYAPAVSDAGR